MSSRFPDEPAKTLCEQAHVARSPLIWCILGERKKKRFELSKKIIHSDVLFSLSPIGILAHHSYKRDIFPLALVFFNSAVIKTIELSN